jgi:hypothetical protein
MDSAALTFLLLLPPVAWPACLAFRLGLCGDGDGLAMVTEDAGDVVGGVAAFRAGEGGG